MRWLLKRWYVWLGLVFLMGLGGSAALICSGQSRITQENFERIQDGMTLMEAERILGSDREQIWLGAATESYLWQHGPNFVIIRFRNGREVSKVIHVATAWEALQWYAKKGADKIGMKWH